jgi:hypothetical protein
MNHLVDYVMKRLGRKNGKRYKIHQNRLKFYHASQQKRDSLEKGEEDDESSNGLCDKEIGNKKW